MQRIGAAETTARKIIVFLQQSLLPTQTGQGMSANLLAMVGLADERLLPHLDSRPGDLVRFAIEL